jgi:hypothetical protein
LLLKINRKVNIKNISEWTGGYEIQSDRSVDMRLESTTNLKEAEKINLSDFNIRIRDITITSIGRYRDLRVSIYIYCISSNFMVERFLMEKSVKFNSVL